MKFIQINAFFKADDIPAAEEMICDIFFSYRLKGVICDVPIPEPDEGFGTHTLPKPEAFKITGYLPLIDSSDRTLEKIRHGLEKLSALNIHVKTQTQIVDEKDWADAWKTFFEVTPVTDHIVVKPEWKPYTPKPKEIILHLDPGMAFGTGTHPTTRMCIQMIEKTLKKEATFLDVGTGSGILMITAAKLGASFLSGIDTDETAISIAAENLAKNNISSQSYMLSSGTLENTPASGYDVIAANIIAQVIIEILPAISDRMHKGTITILSGIIEERLPEINTALGTHNLDIVEHLQIDEWVALAVKKKA